MSQPLRLASLLALVAFPLLEIGLLIRAGQALGFWRLALIVVLTAILGSVAIRRIGLAVFTRARAEIEAGHGGLEPLLDGLLQVTAGLLLIFPGLISDFLGICLLVPQLRQRLTQRVLPRLFRTARYETRSTPGGSGHAGAGGAGPARTAEGVTIEGEYERLGEKDVPPETALRPRRATK